MMQFAENLEHLEADMFLWSSFGCGLDQVAPELVMVGPPPMGARKANLDSLTRSIIGEFALQEVGHLRALKTTVGGFPMPFLDLSAKNFAKLFNEAFGYELEPPFDPYRDSLSYLLAAYVVPYVALLGYVGTNPNLIGCVTKRECFYNQDAGWFPTIITIKREWMHLQGLVQLLAGLGMEAGQDAVIRAYLYERAEEVVKAYNHTVAEFATRISELRKRLAMCGIKDEGIIVPPSLGAENRTESNVLSADAKSLAYSRTPPEILRIVYGSGNEHVPGGFFPEGANGRIARQFLHKP